MQPLSHHLREVFLILPGLPFLKPSPPLSGAGTLAAKPNVENPIINNNDKTKIGIFLCMTNLLFSYVVISWGNYQLSNIGMTIKNRVLVPPPFLQTLLSGWVPPR